MPEPSVLMSYLAMYRDKEEIAAFQQERSAAELEAKSVASEASEASPWAVLQKTYSHIEDSGHSSSGQPPLISQGSMLPQHQIITVDGAADMQVTSKLCSCLHLACCWSMCAAMASSAHQLLLYCVPSICTA